MAPSHSPHRSSDRQTSTTDDGSRTGDIRTLDELARDWVETGWRHTPEEPFDFRRRLERFYDWSPDGTQFFDDFDAERRVSTNVADYADRSLGIGYPGGTLILAALLMFSQTLGTALGDWTADSAGLGYTGAALIFSGLLGVVALAYFFTKLSHTLLFWAAFVLTRPLGAVVGDYLDKPVANGGLEFSRYTATGVLLAAIIILVVLIPQRAAEKPH